MPKIQFPECCKPMKANLIRMAFQITMLPTFRNEESLQKETTVVPPPFFCQCLDGRSWQQFNWSFFLLNNLFIQEKEEMSALLRAVLFHIVLRCGNSWIKIFPTSEFSREVHIKTVVYDVAPVLSKEERRNELLRKFLLILLLINNDCNVFWKFFSSFQNNLFSKYLENRSLLHRALCV